MKKFIRLLVQLQAYAKNVRENKTKCLLKTTELLLPKFDIWQGKMALNCFKNLANS